MILILELMQDSDQISSSSVFLLSDSKSYTSFLGTTFLLYIIGPKESFSKGRVA